MSTNRQQQRGPAWLEDYVSADEKVTAFRRAHPTARVLTNIVEGREPLTFRAEIYFEDNATTIPNATGHTSVDGGSGNRSQSPVEKTETAAISRALWVLGFGGEAEHDSSQKAATERAPLRAAPTGNVNKDIMTALEILSKTEEGLNEYVRKTYNRGAPFDWTELAAPEKGEVLAYLNRLVDKAVQQAR